MCMKMQVLRRTMMQQSMPTTPQTGMTHLGRCCKSRADRWNSRAARERRGPTPGPTPATGRPRSGRREPRTKPPLPHPFSPTGFSQSHQKTKDTPLAKGYHFMHVLLLHHACLLPIYCLLFPQGFSATVSDWNYPEQRYTS